MIRKFIPYVLFFFWNLAFGQVIFVSPDGTGSGSSWVDATSDLQFALSNANYGSQIWVSAGVYYPVVCDPCTENHREITFEIPDGVSVYGGFAGNEINLEQRDWQTNLTILSGDIDQNTIREGNAQTIVHFTNVSASTILDGLILEEGYAVTENAPIGERFNSGGAIYNKGVLAGNTSHPVLRNCVLRNNYAAGFGGAIFNNGAFGGSTDMQFENCIFIHNQSVQGGGAIYNDGSFNGSVEETFVNCTFEENIATWTGGGAILNQGSESGLANTQFIDCQFNSNSTGGHGGAVLCIGRSGVSDAAFTDCVFLSNSGDFGGAIANNGTLQGEANATILNCHFEGNSVSSDGGALYNWGTEGVSNSIVSESIFESNHSNFAGAGIFNNGIEGVSNASIFNCQFIENVSDTYGAAIYNNGKSGDASAEIANCLFLKNSASSAGAIYNLGSLGGNSSPRITNCTFYENSANVGGAVYSNASDPTGTADPIITNCIFWNNTAAFGSVFRNIESTTTVQYSLVDQGSCGDLFSGSGAQVDCGDGMFFEIFPEFMDASNENFRLKSISPIIDQGFNEAVQQLDLEFDLDHQSRIVNTVVDLGAYEFSNSFLPLIITQQPPGSIENCEYSSISLTIEVEGTGPYAFQWFKDAAPLDGAINQELYLESVLLTDAAEYHCVVTSPFDSVITSSTMVDVLPSVVPEISLSVSDTNICAGSSVAFLAEWVNAGASPVVTWYRNDIVFATNVSSINLDDLEQEEEIYVRLVSNNPCAAMDTVVTETISFTVNSAVDANLALVGPGSPICEGSTATFELDYTNAGSEPFIQWYLNDVPVLEDESTFESSDLVNGDIIYATLISDASCATEIPYFSDTITIIIQPLTEVELDIIGPDSTVCLGDNLLLEASYNNGGDTPIFEWMINDNIVPNNTSQTFETNALEIGDSVTLIMLSSEFCVSNPSISDTFIPMIDSCAILSSNLVLENFKYPHLFPNPSSGQFQIDLNGWEGECEWQIINFAGQLVKQSNFTSDFNNYSLTLTISEPGIYFVKVKNNFYHKVFKLLIF